MNKIASVALLLSVALLAGCVGYFQIGGSRTRPDSVQINYTKPVPVSSTCPPYEMPPETDWPAYPQFTGKESDDEVIDSLGHEIVTLHERHRAYVKEHQRKYQEYIQRCMAQ